GQPDDGARARLIQRVDAVYPAETRELNAMLCELLVYLEAPKVAEKTLKLMKAALTQEEQMEYAKSLRMLRTGWTASQRREYFAWYEKAQGFRGGSSFRGFLRLMLDDAVKPLSETERVAVRKRVDTAAMSAAPPGAKTRPFVKNWKLDETVALVDKGLAKKRDFDRGRKLFGEANCFSCHRFDNEGG